MISKTIIADKSARFLSEVINEIPSQCLLNKGVTGCGGTTLEIQSKRDSIILVPNINLVLNKTKAHRGLIGVYGEVLKYQFDDAFKKQRSYKKIIATYDSLPKLIEWIGDDIYDYFLLIDEYHILFNSYAFRYQAIRNVLNLYRRFNDFCFMTATPLNEDNVLEELKYLPQILVTWPQAVNVTATIKNVYYTSKEVVRLIEDSLKENYNLHIFINSLNTIRSIVKLIDTDNFRTICSKVAEREDNKNGGKLQVRSINSDVCKINFYTATAFEGVDIYDPVGKTVVVSDTNIAQSLVDISTLFIQICGRLRDSIYKDQVLFICNTNNHRYLQHKTEDEFNKYSEKLKIAAIDYGIDFLKQGPNKIDIDLGAYDANPTYFQGRYIGRNENIMDYDPNLKKVDIQNYNIITKMFKSTISVINNINQTDRIKVKSDLPKIYTEIFNALPSLQLSNSEVVQVVIPLLIQNSFLNGVQQYSIINTISDKRNTNKNGKRCMVYDFTKLKLLLGK